jgi:hypothetical protein
MQTLLLIILRSYLTLIRLLRECLLSRGQYMYVSIWNSRSYLTLIRFSWDVSSTEDKGSMVVYGITDLTWPWRTSPGMSPIMILVIWIASACVALPDIIFIHLKRFEKVPEDVSDLLMSCQPGLNKDQQTVYQIALIVSLQI